MESLLKFLLSVSKFGINSIHSSTEIQLSLNHQPIKNYILSYQYDDLLAAWLACLSDRQF